MAAIGRVLLMPKGDYSGSAIYNSLDWVRDNGAAWVCKVDGTQGIAPPTLPVTSNANWQVLAEDGSVSGAVDWGNVNNKPFDDIAVGGGLDVDNNKKLLLDPNFLVGSNIGYDNTTSQLTATNVQDAIDEIAQGGGGGDTVSWNQIQGSTGATKIAEITINGNKENVYAPQGGGGGASKLDDLSDVSITGTPSQGETLIANSSGIFENQPMPQGGHTMIPTTNDIATITGLQNGNDNYVINAYSAKRWSNAETMTLFTTVAQGVDTVGTWDDNWTGSGASRSGWLWHSALHGILSDNEVEITFVFDVNNNGADSETVSVYAYRVDDDVQNNGVDGGAIAIKLNGAIQNASGVKIGVNLKRQRTEVGNLTVL